MIRFNIAAILAAVLASCGQNKDIAIETECGADALNTARMIRVDGSASIHSQLSAKEVVLTYDDGPHRKETSRVLQELAKECAHATFFLLGQNAQKHPDLVRLIHDQGHTIGGHSWSHPSLISLSQSDAAAQIRDGNAAIEAALQTAEAYEATPITLFRFPFLHINDTLSEHLDAQGLIAVWVHADGSDWTGKPATEVVDEIFLKLERSGDKGVILLHPPAGQADDSTRLLLQRLKQNGYSVVGLKPAL